MLFFPKRRDGPGLLSKVLNILNPKVILIHYAQGGMQNRIASAEEDDSLSQGDFSGRDVDETKRAGPRSWMSWCTVMFLGLESATGWEYQTLRQKTSMPTKRISTSLREHIAQVRLCLRRSGTDLHQLQARLPNQVRHFIAVPIKLNLSAANGPNGTICMKPSG